MELRVCALMRSASRIRCVFVILFAVLALLLPVVAQAKRVAFVLGIDGYANLDAGAQLKRAVNDARGMALALREFGFDVTPLENAKRSTFNAAWQQFLGAIEPDDEVAFFFSGHGVEIEGQNFLVPGDIRKVSYGWQIKRESVSLSKLLQDLRRRKPRVSLIILDTCRDHPLAPPKRRSDEKSVALVEIDESHGIFIMYSAEPGERALDRLPGNDPDLVNSAYMRKLLPLIRKPGLTLTDIAKQVRREVSPLAASVSHTQTPAYYNGLMRDYCLAGCADQPPASDLRSQGSVLTKAPGNRIVLTTRRPTDVALRFMVKVISRSHMADSVISLKGLPTTAKVSTGIDAGDGQWLVPHRRLKDLTVTLLKGFSSDFKFEILLSGKEVELSDPVTLVLNVGLAL
jgi:hypothetical protein